MHAWWVIFIVIMTVGVASCAGIALCFLVTKTLMKSTRVPHSIPSSRAEEEVRKKKVIYSKVSSLEEAPATDLRQHEEPEPETHVKGLFGVKAMTTTTMTETPSGVTGRTSYRITSGNPYGQV
jgi:hypothetical protein